MCQQTQIITVETLAVFPVESYVRDRNASSRKGSPKRQQRNKPTCASILAAKKKNQNTRMSFGHAIFWMIGAILATGLYFLTRIDIAPPTSSTAASIINDTTQAEETLPPMHPSTLFSTGMDITNVPHLIFGNKDGTCLKITVHGKVLKYGGGEGTKYPIQFMVDGVQLDKDKLLSVPCDYPEDSVKNYY
jgi:hypothetical protein